jgi:hypothetical protein
MKVSRQLWTREGEGWADHERTEFESTAPPLALRNLQQRPEPEYISQHTAVRLLMQRAAASQPDFQVTTLTGSTRPAYWAGEKGERAMRHDISRDDLDAWRHRKLRSRDAAIGMLRGLRC